MPRASRASQATVDTVHRLVGRELARQLKEATKNGAPASAALLAAGISYLKLTSTTDPLQPKRKDTLRIPDFDKLERGFDVPPRGSLADE